jgi:hypothetical protein
MCRLVTLSNSLHTNQPFVYHIKYLWRHITKPRRRTHMFFPFNFRPLLYSILRHFSFFLCSSIPFLPPPPHFAALGERPICLFVKSAVHMREYNIQYRRHDKSFREHVLTQRLLCTKCDKEVAFSCSLVLMLSCQ